MPDTYIGNRAIYNGIEFRDVLTEDVAISVQKDSTGTDPIFVNIALTFKGIVHTLTSGDYLGAEGPSVDLGVNQRGYQFTKGGSKPPLSDGMKKVQCDLSEPRRRFKFYIGDEKWYDVRPILKEPTEDDDDDSEPEEVGHPLEGYDVNKGPTTNLHVFKVIDDHSAHVRITVTFAIVCCDNSLSPVEDYAEFNAFGGEVLHMRYWFADDINGENWLTTRTWQGRVRVASQRVTTHALRYAILPPLMRGYLRKRLSFNESPDGLELEFRILDEQQGQLPPHPASSWAGYHMVSTPFIGGAVMEEQIFVRLTGPKGVDKISLLGLATRIINAKVHYLDQYNDGSVVLLNASYRDDFKDNTVEAMSRFRLVGKGAGGESFFNVPTFQFGLPLSLQQSDGSSYDPDTPPYVTPPEGSLGEQFTCALQNPCRPATIAKAADILPILEGRPSSDEGYEPVRNITKFRPHVPKYSEAHRVALYADYKVDSDLFFDEGVVWLPRAKVEDQSQSLEDHNVTVQLYEPQCIREIRIEGERLNTWPVMPDRVSWTDGNNIKHTILEYKLLSQGNELSADGIKTIFRIGVQIRYILSRAPVPGEDHITTGFLPYRTSDGVSSSYTISNDAFVEPWKLTGGDGQLEDGDGEDG